MTEDPRKWNEPIDVKVTHDQLNRALTALRSYLNFDFEDLLMAGKAVAIMDALDRRFERTDAPGAAEAAVGGNLNTWAMDTYRLVDPEAEKRYEEGMAVLMKSQEAKFEAAVAKRIAELGYPVPATVE
jgi:hypothetical protein